MAKQEKIQSGVAMMTISGSGIRALREKQELTQLYLATAVGVTTETISRWERAEYPTIKRENGLKLAEALGVGPDALVAPPETPAPEEVTAAPSLPSAPPGKKDRRWLLILLLPLILLYLYFSPSKQVSADFSVQRMLPEHTISGHFFPVVIKAVSDSRQTSSLILKEQLPASCRVLQTVPAAAAVDENLLKWVDKNGSGERLFAYLATCDFPEDANPSFDGSLLIRQSSRHEFPVNGRSRIRSEPFHWADRNKDNVIDDEELLGVYDDYGQVKELHLDVEFIESIWMGSGYRLEDDGKTIEIIP